MGGRILDDFSEEDVEVLVRIVKTAQRRNVKGRNGEWKDFLGSRKELRVGPSDPAKRPWTALAEFVKTFTDDADIQMVNQLKSAELRSKRLDMFEKAGAWKSSPEQDLVRRTYQHRRYKDYYSFPTFEEEWVQTDSKRSDSHCVSVQLVSLDCEMVECNDKTKALVRVCAIDSEYKVLLDMIVKPNRPVIDYLTPVTGISEANLRDVIFDFHDAQAAVLKLLTANTFLVGHSLHNDLKALKIDHLRVIDTSFLFQYRNKPECYNAGLSSLCKAILGYEFREDDKPHDCVLDATIPMKIVHHVLNHGVAGPIDVQLKKVDECQLSKLYIHSIPSPVSVDDLQKLIPHKYSCILEAISRSNVKFGTTYAVFKSIDDANNAFEQLEGLSGQDSYGRPQKTVMVTFSYKNRKIKKVPVRVRKMSADDIVGMEIGPVLTSVSESNGFDSAKKRKVTRELEPLNDMATFSPCCNHAQEVESLKKQLHQRIAEVQALQKIILDLSRN